MADDGGSSGKLREQLGMLPPGDIRNCLVALSDDHDGLARPAVPVPLPGGRGARGSRARQPHHRGAGRHHRVVSRRDRGRRALPARARARATLRRSPTSSCTASTARAGISRARRGSPSARTRSSASTSSPSGRRRTRRRSRRSPRRTSSSSARARSTRASSRTSSSTGSPRPSATRTRTRIYVCNVANMRGETGGLDAADHVAALVEHGLAGAVDLVLVHEPCVRRRRRVR